MNRVLLNLHFTLLTQKHQVIPPSWSPSCNLFDEFQTTWLFTDKLFQTRFKLSSLSFIFHIRPFRKKNPMKILCFRTQLEFSRLNASFRACSKACGADGSADPFPDLRGKKSQRRAGRGLTCLPHGRDQERELQHKSQQCIKVHVHPLVLQMRQERWTQDLSLPGLAAVLFLLKAAVRGRLLGSADSAQLLVIALLTNYKLLQNLSILEYPPVHLRADVSIPSPQYPAIPLVSKLCCQTLPLYSRLANKQRLLFFPNRRSGHCSTYKPKRSHKYQQHSPFLQPSWYIC